MRENAIMRKYAENVGGNADLIIPPPAKRRFGEEAPASLRIAVGVGEGVAALQEGGVAHVPPHGRPDAEPRWGHKGGKGGRGGQGIGPLSPINRR